MDPGTIDLGVLTFTQLLGLTALVTVIDVVGAIALAISQGKFDLAYVAAWLQSHTVKRVFPIFGLAVLGIGIGTDGSITPPIPLLFGLAQAGLLAYLLETVASLRTNFANAAAVRDETPVPPPTT
jgi:hypothetical protein